MANDDPMMASVAGRYASALYSLATEQNQVKLIEQQMTQLQAMLAASSDLRTMVRSPVFTADEQGRSLDAVLNASGISGLTANFVKLIARNRRLFVLPDMIRNFHQLVAQGRGEMQARVSTATALTDGQMQQLKDTLRASVGKDVAITADVDPALLGGLVVKIGSRMIDGSLRTKLDSLKIAMKEVG